MKIRKLLIVDGYTDEPAGLGVPPYIDVYPREAYGALKMVDKGSEIYYMTIDEVRKNVTKFAELSKKVDLVLVIAGALVPGRYLGGEPLREWDELERLTFLSASEVVLGGPAASFGLGGVGGTRSQRRNSIRRIRGSIARWIYEAGKYGIEYAEDIETLEYYKLRSKALILGAEVVIQHPNLRLGNLIVEIETYKGCPRWKGGGCSFCLDPLYGKPLLRKVDDIIREVEALYYFGVRNLRIGRQSDITVYGSPDLGLEEWPRPNPKAIESLFRGIRHVAPSLQTLHIDNVNPGTLVRWEKESEEVLKVIVKYHTPGDVAAMGIESVDPKVVKLNNLKVDLEGAIKAIEIVNKVGRQRGWNGLPHLLPGLNFIAGLMGESKETWRYNIELLNEIERRGLLVRRVNLRKVSVLEGTRLALMMKKVKIAKGYEKFRRFVMEWQERMLRKVIPKGTILYNVMVERVSGNVSYARQPGSYPITIEIPQPMREGEWVAVRIKRHHARSAVAEIVWRPRDQGVVSVRERP